MPRKSNSKYETKMMPLSELKPHPKNYRVHSDIQIEHLVESLKRYGYYRNIVIANDNTILAGHGVWQAAKKMRRKEMPVRQMDFDPDDPRALHILTGDNEMAGLAEKDDRALTELLKEIRHSELDTLLGTGFDESMLAALAMVTRPIEEIADFNEAAEWLGMPEYESMHDPLKIIMSFANEKNRQAFAEKIGAKISDKTISLWWPLKEGRDDISSLKFEIE